VRSKSPVYVSILTFLLILTFLFFSSPGLLTASRSAVVVRHVEDAVVGTSREAMPVIIKVIYQVEGRPIVKYPPVMAYIGVGIVTERIVVNDEAVLYLTPGNYSLTVSLSDRRLATFRDMLSVNAPLHVTITYEEIKHRPLRVEVVKNQTTNISMVSVTIGSISGQRVYASLPVLYFYDGRGILLKYPDVPESSDLPSVLPYYLRIDQQSSNDSSAQMTYSQYSFRFLVPADVAYLIDEYSYVPILIINSTINEMEIKNVQHH
jgi:hypothetical protein